MPSYRRAIIPGGCFFFTVNLPERRQTLLVDQIASLREAAVTTRRSHPFMTDAFVVLPDHLHAVWTLPTGDSDFSTRWRLIKSGFSRALRRSESAFPTAVLPRASAASGNGAIGSTPCAMRPILAGMSITFISIRSSTAWSGACATDRIRRSTKMSAKGSIRRTGRARRRKSAVNMARRRRTGWAQAKRTAVAKAMGFAKSETHPTS